MLQKMNFRWFHVSFFSFLISWPFSFFSCPVFYSCTFTKFFTASTVAASKAAVSVPIIAPVVPPYLVPVNFSTPCPLSLALSLVVPTSVSPLATVVVTPAPSVAFVPPPRRRLTSYRPPNFWRWHHLQVWDAIGGGGGWPTPTRQRRLSRQKRGG